MHPADLLRFAATALVGHRLRSALTILGLAVGIAAVVTLTSLGEGARRFVVGEFEGLGSNLLIIIPGKVETTGMMPFGGVVHDLTLEDARAVAQRIPDARRVAPLAMGTETVRWGGRGRSAAVLGTSADLLEVRRLRMGSGSFLSASDFNAGGAEVVLGAKVARELFADANPLGAAVRIGQWRFRVIGVLAPRGRSMGIFDMDDLVMVPVKTGMAMFNRTSLFRVLVEVRSPTRMASAKDDIIDLLQSRHRAEDVTVISQDAVVSSFSSILRAMTLALAGIASVSLAVAGVGIMNVMLVSVTERTREIGLLKALGASNRQILAAFLTEAVILASIGGVAGILVGTLAVEALMHVYPDFPATPPLWALASAMSMALVVGVGFGVLPARRATRLDPIAALAGRS